MDHRSRGSAAVGAMAVTFTLIGWTSVPLFLRYFSETIDPWTSNGWRYGFAALVWAPLVVLGRVRRTLPAGIWRAALVPSLINAVGQVAFTVAHYRINPGLLSFGLRSQMLFAAAGAYILFAGERPIIRSPGYAAGLAAVLVGTSGAVLLGGEPVLGAQAEGIVLSILSGACFAGYALAVRRYMMDYSAVIAFAVISLYTATAMVALMLALGDRGGLGALDMTGLDFGLLLLSALVGIALGHVFYYMSIARLGVAVSSGVLQLHPFTVGVASYYLFHEVLSAAQWVSGFVAVAGALLMLSVGGRVARRRRHAVAAVGTAPPPRV